LIEIKNRNKAWYEYNKRPVYQNQQKYKLLRNKVIEMIKNAKILTKSFEMKVFELKLVEKIKDDLKSFYAYVRAKSIAKIQIGLLRNNLGEICDDTKAKSKILNDHFASVFTKEDLSILPEAKIRENSYQPNKDVDQLEPTGSVHYRAKVIKALGNMKQNKTGGGDGLNSSYLSSLGYSIVISLTKKKTLSKSPLIQVKCLKTKKQRI